MKLSKKEKEKIFWSLVNSYPEHERSRKQANSFFGRSPEKFKEILEKISLSEEEHYKLIKKFSEELNIEMPERVRK